MSLFPTDIQSVISRLRKGPQHNSYGAVGYDGPMLADALEDLDRRLRALEAEPPTGEPGRRPE